MNVGSRGLAAGNWRGRASHTSSSGLSIYLSIYQSIYPPAPGWRLLRSQMVFVDFVGACARWWTAPSRATGHGHGREPVVTYLQCSGSTARYPMLGISLTTLPGLKRQSALNPAQSAIRNTIAPCAASHSEDPDVRDIVASLRLAARSPYWGSPTRSQPPGAPGCSFIRARARAHDERASVWHEHMPATDRAAPVCTQGFMLCTYIHTYGCLAASPPPPAAMPSGVFSSHCSLQVKPLRLRGL